MLNMYFTGILLFVLLWCVIICHTTKAFRTAGRIRRKRPSECSMVAQHMPDLSKSSSSHCGVEAGGRINGSITAQSHKLNCAQPVVVGIAGGSASGKTTFAKSVIDALGSEHAIIIGHDSYYKELNHLSIEQRSVANFDHPDALDTDLLISHLYTLKAGRSVEVPVYDFNTHSRTAETQTVDPSRVIVVDGILIFAEPELLELMDMKIFVDTDDDIRLIRRIQRDIDERGRSVESVIEQYQRTVRPMHQIYVEPSKRGADIIVPASLHGSPPTVALEMCVSRLREIINFYQ